MQTENSENKKSFLERSKESFTPFQDFFTFLFEIAKIIVISLLIIMPIRFFIIQPFYVKGASMEPSFYNHDYLIVDEISYRFSPPSRGDVIIFRYPKDETQFFIKRVIGLPGERVVMKDNHIFIYNDKFKDGLQLKEEYLSEDEINPRPVDIVVPDGHYFVMGDNRDSSMDSTIFGPIEKRLIIGRVWIRGFPIDEMKIFSKYNYQIIAN